MSESEKSVHETFFGCSRSRILHTVASALAQATTSCTLAAAAVAARLYMWHISNFYIIPSMNRNLMNGTFLVCCTFAVFIHSWPICMCSDYTIFSFLIRFFCRSFVRATHKYFIYILYVFTFIGTRFHPSSTGMFPHQHQHFSLASSLMLCIYFRTSHIVESEREREEKKQNITTHALASSKPKARIHHHTFLVAFS